MLNAFLSGSFSKGTPLPLEVWVFTDWHSLKHSPHVPKLKLSKSREFTAKGLKGLKRRLQEDVRDPNSGTKGPEESPLPIPTIHRPTPGGSGSPRMGDGPATRRASAFSPLHPRDGSQLNPGP